MNIKDIKNEIVKFGKTLAGLNFESDAIKLQEDEVKISDKAVGAKTEQVMTDGTLEPLADGKYDLDGFVFEVKDGVIATIEGQEETEEATVEAEMEEEKPVEEAPAEVTNEIAELKAEIESLKEVVKAITDAKDENAAIAEEMKSEFSKLNETLMQFAKIPAENTKTNNTPTNNKSKEDKFNKLAGMFAK